MRNPFRRKDLTASADVVSSIRSGWQAVQVLGGGPQQRIENAFTVAQNASYTWRYRNSPAVRSVVDVIVRNVGQLELRLYEEIGDNARQPKFDHPAALSLAHPNGRMTRDALIRALFLDYLIHDNAYAVMNPGVDEQTSIVRIPAYMVEVMGSQLFEVENYRIWPQGAWVQGNWGGSGHWVDIDPDNMIHWHGENPLDPRVGLSRLDTLADVIAEDAALQQAITELAQAGLTQALWVFRPENAPEISPKARRGLEEDLGNRLRRRNRTPIVLDEGSEFRPYSISPEDAQMMEVRRWVAQRIASVYGVPMGMIGGTGGAGRSGAPPSAEDRTLFLADVVAPLVESFCLVLNQRLLVDVYDYKTGAFSFNMDEKFAGDARMTALVAATGRPVLTTDEARSMIDRPPVEGGDKLITPLNVMVGSNPLPSPQVMPPQSPTGAPQDGSFRADQNPLQAAASSTPNEPNAKAVNGNGAIDHWHPRFSGDMARQQEAIKRLEGPLNRFYRRLEDEIPSTKAYKASEGNWARRTLSLAEDLLAAMRKTVRHEADVYMRRLGGAEFDQGQVEHYLEQKAKGAASGIVEKVRQEFESLGRDAALERRGSHVAAAGGHLGVTTTTFARVEAAKQCPGADLRVKSWVADTARHEALDGLTVPLGEEWPNGFAPGTAPNCRCTFTVT